MELFVINRHDEEKCQVTEEEEKIRLERVLKRIEKKKQLRVRQRERQKQAKLTTKVPQKSEKGQPKHSNEVPTNDTPKPLDKTKVDNFTVLGAGSFEKPKAKRVLPLWLSKPSIISSNLQNLTVKVSKIKHLDKSIRKQLKSNGIEFFFPVQAQVIPWLLDIQKEANVMHLRDVCVSAPTGSGKTLAFVLPVIQTLQHYTVRKVRALVILPTQDLADQVFRTFKTYTKGTCLETGLISGKHLFNVEQQQLVYFNEAFGYVSKIDILVCTAGRLVSHLKLTTGFSLHSLEFLIIDEADRVLENVQDDWLYHLETHIGSEDFSVQSKRILNLKTLRHKSPQKLLFSATLSQDPEKLEKLSLFQPKLFTSVMESSEMEEDQETFVGKYTTPKELTEKYIVCSKQFKPLVLHEFIKSSNLTKTLVFTHSVESAHRLKILLASLFKSKLKIEEVSASLKGSSRDELIAKFSTGNIDVLICTDSLARGIDLPSVKCVVSYSAPKYLKTYIHRAGRTARAGESGLAVTILHNQQLSSFKSLLTQANKTDVEELKICEDLEKLHKLYNKGLKKLKETVNKEEKTGISKKKRFQRKNKK